MSKIIHVFTQVIIEDEDGDYAQVDNCIFKLFETKDPQKVQDFINCLDIRKSHQENNLDEIASSLIKRIKDIEE